MTFRITGTGTYVDRHNDQVKVVTIDVDGFGIDSEGHYYKPTGEYHHVLASSCCDIVGVWKEPEVQYNKTSEYNLELVSERWLPAKGYEGHYEVSSIGRVRRLTRRGGKSLRKEPKILSSALAHGGYPAHCLYKPDGSKRTENVHRLMLRTFVGEPPEPGLQCAHLNGNPADCRIENLAWATATENNAHKRDHGTHLFGEDCYNSRFKQYEVAAAKVLYALGVSDTDIGELLETTHSQAHALVRYQWKHIDAMTLLVEENIKLRLALETQDE